MVCACLVFPDVVTALFMLVYCYVCMPGVCVCVCVFVCRWKSEDNFVELVVYFYLHADSRTRT